MDNFINALSSLAITRREGNNQTQPPRLQLGNVPTELFSNNPATSSQRESLSEINGGDFRSYMKNHKEEQTTSRMGDKIDAVSREHYPLA